MQIISPTTKQTPPVYVGNKNLSPGTKTTFMHARCINKKGEEDLERESTCCALVILFSHSSQLWFPRSCQRAAGIATLRGLLRKPVGDPLPSCHLSGTSWVLFLLTTSWEFWIHCQAHLWKREYSLTFRKMPRQMNEVRWHFIGSEWFSRNVSVLVSNIFG